MQDKKLINVSQAVIGGQGVYSIEFHEDQHYTHVKRVNTDGTATYFSVGGSGAGTTDYIQTLELVNNGLGLSSTGIGSAFNTTLDVTPLRLGMVTSGYLSGNSPSTVYVGGSTPAQNGHVNGDWIIDLDTSNIWYLANADTNVWVQSQGQSGSVTETNLVAQKSAGLDTNNVSAYGFSDTAVNLTLSRTDNTDVDFVLRAGFSLLGSNNFGIIQAKVVLNATGFGNIKLQYEDMTGTIVDITPVALSSGVAHLVFAYWGNQRMQLLSYQLA